MKLFKVDTRQWVQIVRSSRGNLYFPIPTTILGPIAAYNFLVAAKETLWLPRNANKKWVVYTPFIETDDAVRYAVKNMCELRPDGDFNRNDGRTLFISGTNTGFRVAESITQPDFDMVKPHFLRFLYYKQQIA